MTDKSRQPTSRAHHSPATGKLSRQIENNVIENVFANRANSLFSYIRRLTNDEEAANDICQEAFFVLSRKAADLNLLKEPYAYLKTVASHMVQGWHKECARTRAIAKNPCLLENAWVNDQSPVYTELSQSIEQTLQALPPRAQEVFLLKVYKHMSSDEIAAHLGVTSRTVRRDINRIQQRLKQGLGV